MSTTPPIAHPSRPRRPRERRSKNSDTLATWRTDRKLRILAIRQAADVPIRSLPMVGMVVSKGRRRTGILDRLAHLRALRGKSSRYVFKLFRRTYQVAVAPRYDRNRKIVGVRGTLIQVPDPLDRNGPSAPEAPRLESLVERRHRNSNQSAVRSLELARAMANSARRQADLRIRQAAEQEQRAVEARLRAEEEKRRARLLADASAVLDHSFDRIENLDRLAELLVHRTADWCVIYAREGDRLRRLTVFHREASEIRRIERAFTMEEEGAVARNLLACQPELFSSVTPADLAILVPPGDRTRALKEWPLQSLIRTALRMGGKVIGLLILGSEDPGRVYGVLDLRMVRDLAHRLALSEESVRLYDEAQKEIALRKEAEARLRVFNAELERRISERTHLLEEAMREANNFAYTVAHDLRAPLRAIAGFCQALQEDCSDALDEKGQDYVARIVSGARKMDDLIRDLLDYARLNRAEIKQTLVDLDGVADEVLQQMAAELLERHASVEVVRPLGRVVGHAPVLAQVLTHLISNAAKFVAPGVMPAVRIGTERRDGHVRIFVQDNGIGIVAQHQERIFGIFERLNRAEDYPGTGIGLAIVRRAIERLGGGHGVESEPGRGSRFWIELPQA